MVKTDDEFIIDLLVIARRKAMLLRVKNKLITAGATHDELARMDAMIADVDKKN